MDEHDGIQILLTLLRSLLSNTDEGADKLRTIACGFLLNLTNTHGKKEKNQGTVIQSIISLMSSLRGQLVKCFRTL